jgi:hypothetical protein
MRATYRIALVGNFHPDNPSRAVLDHTGSRSAA